MHIPGVPSLDHNVVERLFRMIESVVKSLASIADSLEAMAPPKAPLE